MHLILVIFLFLPVMVIFVRQMKKLFASILLLVYFVVSTGFVVSVHYCMNKVDSVQLGSGDEECGKCGMIIEDSNRCCKDDVKLVKMHVDQVFAKTVTPDFSLQLSANSLFSTDIYSLVSSVIEDYPNNHGPPLSKQDTYLRNCVFRL
jgi:hypothetical protein